jgi:hypothetical protein
MPGHEGDLPLQLSGEEPVVGVEEAQQLAARHLEAALPGRAASPVLREALAADAGVAARLKDRPRPIGGAVVDGQRLPVLIALGLERRQRHRKGPIRVVAGHHDRHERIRRHY